jgi:transposase-like protein
MGREIEWEIRERAEELYIVDGLTFEEVARETDISVSQLKAWSTAERWREKRNEYRDARKNVRSTVMQLRQQLAKDALANPDPQKIFAFIRLETLAEKKERKPETAAAKIDRPALFLEDVEFIAGFLRDQDPEGLKVLARNFDGIIEAFKAKHAQAS